MNTKVFLSLLVLISIVITSCHKDELVLIPSHEISQKEIHLNSAFDRINVSETFKVYVNFSEEEKPVRIEANENLMEYVNLEIIGDELIVDMDDEIHLKLGIPTLKVYITCSNLEGIIVSGAAKVYFENTLHTDMLELNISGASKFDGKLNVSKLEAELDGNSYLEIEGNSNNFSLDLDGSSHMRGYDFETLRLDADFDGASDAKMTVQEEINVTVDGVSTLYYKGDAYIMTQHISGASRIIKK